MKGGAKVIIIGKELRAKLKANGGTGELLLEVRGETGKKTS